MRRCTIVVTILAMATFCAAQSRGGAAGAHNAGSTHSVQNQGSAGVHTSPPSSTAKSQPSSGELRPAHRGRAESATLPAPTITSKSEARKATSNSRNQQDDSKEKQHVCYGALVSTSVSCQAVAAQMRQNNRVVPHSRPLKFFYCPSSFAIDSERKKLAELQAKKDAVCSANPGSSECKKAEKKRASRQAELEMDESCRNRR